MQRSLLLLAGCCFQIATAFTPSLSSLAVTQLPKPGTVTISTLRSTQKLSIMAPNHTWHTALSSTKNDKGEDDQEAEKEKKRVRDEIFWAKQRALAAEMSAKADAGLKREQQEKFAKRRMALTSDTLYFSILIASFLWLVSSNPFVPMSYLFGALSGTAYSYGLGKYVETIGGSIDDTEAEGAGIGQARFAFLILLFVVVGKFRDQGLLEIPSILGFFTYQLASLGQGLREIDD